MKWPIIARSPIRVSQLLAFLCSNIRKFDVAEKMAATSNPSSRQVRWSSRRPPAHIFAAVTPCLSQASRIIPKTTQHCDDVGKKKVPPVGNRMEILCSLEIPPPLAVLERQVPVSSTGCCSLRSRPLRPPGPGPASHGSNSARPGDQPNGMDMNHFHEPSPTKRAWFMLGNTIARWVMKFDMRSWKSRRREFSDSIFCSSRASTPCQPLPTGSLVG